VIYPPTELHNCDEFRRYICSVDDWYNLLSDAEKFEQAFPGAGHRCHDLFQAARPLFYNATDNVVWTLYQMVPFFEWTKLLLTEEFEEAMLPVASATKPPVSRSFVAG
jgi:hypothetical protein